MEEKTELNDIILNQGNSGGGGKKILLAVASLVIILIIIVVIMNSIQSDSTNNLPQPILPKKPQSLTSNTQDIIEEDPLFEPIEVIEEPSSDDNLAQIAKKLKEDSIQEEIVEVLPQKNIIVEKPKPVVISKPKPIPAVVTKSTAITKPVTKASYIKSVSKGKHYIQVGSFTQYKPNKIFLNKIITTGNNYTFHKVIINAKSINKVLIGPFDSKDQAKKMLPNIRKNIIKGAFIVKV